MVNLIRFMVLLTIFIFDVLVSYVLLASILKKNAKYIIPTLVALAFMLIIAVLLDYSFGVGLISASFVILSGALSILYIVSTKRFLLLFIIMVLELAFLSSVITRAFFLAIIGLAIGTFFGFFYIEKYLKKPKKQAKQTKQSIRMTNIIEVHRDYVQILLGAIAIIAILSIGKKGIVLIALLGILAYAIIATLVKPEKLKKNKLLKYLIGLERKGAVYGLGAIFLLAGYLIIAGFINNQHFVVFGVAALFICDALATIVGRKLKKRHSLPYNRSKSIEGSLTFFAAAVLFAFGIFGINVDAILYSLFLAAIESFRLPIDDNITIPIGTIVLYIANLVV